MSAAKTVWRLRGRDGRAEDVAPIGYRALGDNDHSLSAHVRDTAIAIVDLLQPRELGIRPPRRRRAR